MTVGVTLLVLLSAFMHASWNALVKGGRDSFLNLVMVLGPAPVALSAALFFLPFPAAQAWPLLGASVLVHLAYQFLLLGAYRYGDFSRVYPIARGSAPMLVALGAFFWAGETLAPREWMGMAMVTVAILALAFQHGSPFADARNRNAVIFAFLTGVAIAAYSLIDGLGARLSGHALSYTLWMLLLNGIAMLGIAVWRRGRTAVYNYARGEGALRIFAGLLGVSAYAIVLWAMTKGALGPISALREISVIFAALLARIYLGERSGPIPMMAACLAFLGLMFLSGWI